MTRVLISKVSNTFSFRKNEILKEERKDLSHLPTFDSNDVIWLEDLGKGNFGLVKKAFNLFVDNNREYRRDIFLDYYGCFKEANDNSLVLQMKSGIGTLDDILKAGKTYSCPRSNTFNELLAQLCLLQQKGIVNRDIKPLNVIVMEKNKNYS